MISKYVNHIEQFSYVNSNFVVHNKKLNIVQFTNVLINYYIKYKMSDCDSFCLHGSCSYRDFLGHYCTCDSGWYGGDCDMSKFMYYFGMNFGFAILYLIIFCCLGHIMGVNHIKKNNRGLF